MKLLMKLFFIFPCLFPLYERVVPFQGFRNIKIVNPIENENLSISFDMSFPEQDVETEINVNAYLNENLIYNYTSIKSTTISPEIIVPYSQVLECNYLLLEAKFGTSYCFNEFQFNRLEKKEYKNEDFNENFVLHDAQTILGNNENYIYYEIRDSIDISSISSDFDDDTYYRLKIEDFSFIANSATEISSESELLIMCSNKSFPRLPYNEELQGYLLNIKFENDGTGKYSMSFADPFYYDEKTHMMSLESGDYFKPTNSFYFPNEKYSSLRDIPMRLFIKNFGLGHSNITWDFVYHSNSYFAGNCVNSMVCIESYR